MPATALYILEFARGYSFIQQSMHKESTMRSRMVCGSFKTRRKRTWNVGFGRGDHEPNRHIAIDSSIVHACIRTLCVCMHETNYIPLTRLVEGHGVIHLFIESTCTCSFSALCLCAVQIYLIFFFSVLEVLDLFNSVLVGKIWGANYCA